MTHISIPDILRQKALINEMVKELKSIHISVWIASACVVWLLVLTVLPMQTGWLGAESYLCFAIPSIAVVGCVLCCIRKVWIIWSWIDIAVLFWHLYSIGSLWFDTTYPAAGYVVHATLMVTLYVGLRLVFSASHIKGFFIAVMLIAFSLAEAYMGYSQLISGRSHHYLYPVTGSFLNPGPYSAYLALGIILMCALRKEWLLRLRLISVNEKKSFATILDNGSLIIIMVLAVPLVLTMSRSAFLALFICLLILYRHNIKGWKQWAMLILAVTVVGTALYLLKSGSANGRGLINYIGIRSIADNPFFGSGIGSFFHRFAETTAKLSRNNPGLDLTRVDAMDYAFNDLLRVGVEQGVVGLLFAGSLIGLVLFRLWKYDKALFLCALSLLIISFFSYPFELLPYQIIATIIMAFAASASTPIRGRTMVRPYKAYIGLIATIAIICIASAVCYRNITIRKNAERDYNMMAGLHDKAFIKDYYSLLPYLQDNKRFLFDFAKILADQGRYNDSNDMLRRGAQISNDPVFLVLQGNNYRDMGIFEETESMYLKAWHNMPNRIYPLYRLMKLYEQTGDKAKCMEYAQRVMDFKEKVQSPAVNDMKKEAQEIINGSQTNTFITKQTSTMTLAI